MHSTTTSNREKSYSLFPIPPSLSFLHRLPPPGGGLDAEELGLVAAGKVEIHYLVLLERRAVRPAVVFFQVGRFLVIIYQRDLGFGALDHFLRLQGEGGSRRRSRRDLVGNLRQEQDEYEGSGK